MKKHGWILLAAFMLAGCSEEAAKEKADPSPKQKAVEVQEKKSESNGIWQGEVKPSLEQVPTADGTYKFHYEVKNQTEKPVTFVFPTSQMFEYELKDEAGKVVSLYSKGQSFSQGVQEQTVIPGESLWTEMNFNGLKKGSYTLSAWVVAKGDESYRVSLAFEVE